VDPLKTFAATLFCLVLFGLAFRLTKRLMEMVIAAGHEEARRRALAEDAVVGGETTASPAADPAPHTAVVVP
jgi:hypothetical protein